MTVSINPTICTCAILLMLVMQTAIGRTSSSLNLAPKSPAIAKQIPIEEKPFNKAAHTQLSLQQVNSDVDLLKKAYAKLHPGYTRYASSNEMDKAWQTIIDQANVNQGLTLGQFYLSIQQALTEIRCDHTKANLPKAMRDERNTQAMYLPFTWVWIEDRAFVTSAALNSGLSPKDEIIALDGRPIKALVNEVITYIPFDGYTSWSRSAGVASSMEFMGGAVDHFGALLWNITPKVEVSYVNAKQQANVMSIPRLNHKEWTSLAANQDSANDFKDAVTFKRIGDSAAYLRIDTFVNYRNTVDPYDIYAPIFKAIKEEKRNTLILDLRKNGGGSSDASQGLFAHLISHKTQYKLDMRVNTLEFDDIREHLWTWDQRALDPWRIGFSKNDDGSYSLRSWFTDDLDNIKPAEYAFDGKVIALTSNGNSSGSTNLLSAIKNAGRTELVGEKTGGSVEGPTAGLLFTLTLPASKITTRIPFFRQQNNVQEFEKGMGLLPDVKAAMTAEAYLQDQDPALVAALRLISN